jgi:hypothetical protein
LRFSSMLAKRSWYESSDTCVSPRRGIAGGIVRSLDGEDIGEDWVDVVALGHACISMEAGGAPDVAAVPSCNGSPIDRIVTMNRSITGQRAEKYDSI